jgi:type II secretory pathway component GspD/PulD (secretin)
MQSTDYRGGILMKNNSRWVSLSLPVVCSIGLGLLGPPATAQGPGPEKSGTQARKAETQFRLRFANTDVSDVLQTLSLKTKASIVFPSQMKKPISVDITASTTEEALRFVTAAAGLAYHIVGRTYVVATPSELRQAIEPFGTRATLSLASLLPVDAAKMLESALPCLTARPMGKQVLAIGDPEDIAQARSLLEIQDRPAVDNTMQAEVVTLQYANATQVAALVKVMYDGVKAEAVAQPNRPGGSIGISGTKAQLAGARSTIQALDVRGGAGDQEKAYRVYHVRHSSAPLLLDFIAKAAPGVTALIGPETYSPQAAAFHPLTSTSFNTSAGAATSGTAAGPATGGNGAPGGPDASAGGSGTGARVGDRAKMLVLSGAPADIDSATRLLEQLDVAPQQVMVEVKVVDTSPEAAEQIGLQYDFSPLSFFETKPGTDVSANGFGSTTKQAGVGQFSRFPWSFSAALSAMVTRKEAKILASPKVMVVDNEDANIFIGDTIRTKISQASTNGQTIQVLEFPIGIVLLVRPRVNADGRITMRVHPVVSTITSIGADNLPQTSSREAETTVMVKDGETIVLGGLIRDEMLKTVQEVPILAKLPLVGELFRFRSKSHRHSEIMVFITPHILDENGKIVQKAEPKPQGDAHVH